MAIKSILVPMTGGKRDPFALGPALRLARLFGARADCLFIRPDPRETLPMMGDAMSVAVMEDIERATESEGQRRGQQARTNFLEAAAAVGLSAEPGHLPDGPGEAPALIEGEGFSASFAAAMGNVGRLVPQRARCHDLTVMPALAEETAVQPEIALEETLLHSGRPVLLLPLKESAAHWFERFPRQVTLAWDGETESARAAAFALPFMRRAEAVDVLTTSTHGSTHDIEAEELSRVAAWLGHHGIEARTRALSEGEGGARAALLGEAERLRTELFVMGGYGHSRLREIILGGMTRYVIDNVTLPVLMAH